MRNTRALPFRLSFLFLCAAMWASPASAQSNGLNGAPKLDPPLQSKARKSEGRSRVIISAPDNWSLSLLTPFISFAGGRFGRTLPMVNGIVVDVPNGLLNFLANHPLVGHISVDRLVVGAMERTGATIGATTVRQDLGYDGAGVGVAVIDSGAAATLDDLSNTSSGATRVDHFVDFVNGNDVAYDDYGHGTHVAGIIAGNGMDSGGLRSGIAPGARLTVLKVLDASGQGRISDVIAAIDYAVAHKDAWNIRVINLSVATGVYESYNLDPLTLAAQRAVDAGIVVVAAAGNNGRGPHGSKRYGGITAPGNAPWVLTVGASSHMGTTDRTDDTMAAFSSRGPGALDYGAKPDVVAPGVGIESLSDPASAFYVSKAPYLLNGTVPTSYLPYLSLSGTSMAAPVVSGTVALMLQANPQLTPNAVKAILEYTSQRYPDYDRLTQGAGFLNAKGAVELARYLASPAGTDYPAAWNWGRQIVWANRLIQGGQLTADANAWSTATSWGDGVTPAGEAISWGPNFSDAGQNVVWGLECGGTNCVDTTWSIHGSGGAVFATDDGDGDTVVWGTSDDEGDTVVWGTSCTDPSCEPTMWSVP